MCGATIVYPDVYLASLRRGLTFVKLLILLARPKGFEPLTPKFVVWCSKS